MFEIYRSRHNACHFVAVSKDDIDGNARGVRESRNLAFLTDVADEGGTRIAFDAGAARSRIARNGFYAFAVTVEPREHAG
jgi:hypothetical protein